MPNGIMSLDSMHSGVKSVLLLLVIVHMLSTAVPLDHWSYPVSDAD
jgi:hypothetical protein